MNEFIQIDNFNRIGGQYEEIVWNSLKNSFSKRDVLAYSRYPLFMNIGQKRKEPDIIILDKELGFYIIEIKGFSIDNIIKIDGGVWHMKDFYANTLSPFAQAEDYAYDFKSKFDRQRELRERLTIKVLVALPSITKQEFIDKGFSKAFDENLDNFIFADELSKKKLFDKLSIVEPLFYGKPFTDKTFKIAMSILGHEELYINSEESFVLGSKGNIAKKIRQKLYDLDIQQEKIAKVIAIGPQRIRGIAGSGKTILLCQKAAAMYLKNPEIKIAITFFTQSLYDTIKNTVDKYLRAFSNGEVTLNDCPNIKILHAWGSKNINGFYRTIAIENGILPMNVNDVKKLTGNNSNSMEVSINIISKNLLEQTNAQLKEIFDVVLIDEGQDLVGDNQYKYNGKQSFYYMAYKSIKPCLDDEENSHRRIIWAYDELQSLNDTKKPSGKELFGDENIVKGIYKGGARKSEIMKKCYRTPYDILTTAHSVGMGFFREDGMITGYTTKKDWENIGYTVVSGDFRKNGETVNIKRLKENSPNPIHDVYEGKCIDFKTYNSQKNLLESLASSIKNDIEKDGLNPSKDILIITLDKYNKLKNEIANALAKEKINYYIPSSNTINNTKNGNNPDRFWYDDAVTISRINRAKGNEAIMVYVLGIETIAENEDSVSERNKLFTAMTRSKCFLKLMALGDYEYKLYEEIRKSINANGDFKFKFIRPKNTADDNES